MPNLPCHPWSWNLPRLPYWTTKHSVFEKFQYFFHCHCVFFQWKICQQFRSRISNTFPISKSWNLTQPFRRTKHSALSKNFSFSRSKNYKQLRSRNSNKFNLLLSASSTFFFLASLSSSVVASPIVSVVSVVSFGGNDGGRGDGDSDDVTSCVYGTVWRPLTR